MLEQHFHKTHSKDDRKTWIDAQRLIQKKHLGKEQQYWSTRIHSHEITLEIFGHQSIYC